MPKVSVKFQRRIAELDAQYTVPQPKRTGGFSAFRSGLPLIIIAIIAVAAFATYRNTSDDFSRLSLKQGTTTSLPGAKGNAALGAASSGFKRSD